MFFIENMALVETKGGGQKRMQGLRGSLSGDNKKGQRKEYRGEVKIHRMVIMFLLQEEDNTHLCRGGLLHLLMSHQHWYVLSSCS